MESQNHIVRADRGYRRHFMNLNLNEHCVDQSQICVHSYDNVIPQLSRGTVLYVTFDNTQNNATDV